RFIRALCEGSEVPLFGGGMLRRDFTYVGDVVDANLLAASAPLSGHRAFNIGGGNRATHGQALALPAELTGRKAVVTQDDRPRGPGRETGADTTRARAELGFVPKVTLRDGLARQVAWSRDVVLP